MIKCSFIAILSCKVELTLEYCENKNRLILSIKPVHIELKYTFYKVNLIYKEIACFSDVNCSLLIQQIMYSQGNAVHSYLAWYWFSIKC